MSDEIEAAEPAPCQACRGTGALTSKLGGEPHEVPCPWCDGSGTFIPAHDAQATRRANTPAADAQT